MTLPFYKKAVQTIILSIQEIDKRLGEIETAAENRAE